MGSSSRDDPHAWALLSRVEEDTDLDLSLDELVRTAPIWRQHIDAALAADENGPTEEDDEDEPR